MTQREIDNEIKRINRQITQAAKVFGKDSRLYQQYETLLFPKSGAGIGQGVIFQGEKAQFMTRENKQGVIQISRSKRAIEQIEMISQFQKNLQQLSKMQTVQKTKEKIIEKYQERTGIELKTAAEKKAALQEELDNYRILQDKLFNKLQAIYALENQMGGMKSKGHTMIDSISKGHWTSTKELEQMIDIAEKTLNGELIQSEGNRLKGW